MCSLCLWGVWQSASCLWAHYLLGAVSSRYIWKITLLKETRSLHSTHVHNEHTWYETQQDCSLRMNLKLYGAKCSNSQTHSVKRIYFRAVCFSAWKWSGEEKLNSTYGFLWFDVRARAHLFISSDVVLLEIYSEAKWKERKIERHTHRVFQDRESWEAQKAVCSTSHMFSRTYENKCAHNGYMLCEYTLPLLVAINITGNSVWCEWMQTVKTTRGHYV